MASPSPTDAERLRARSWPNGFLYRIAASCGSTERVPPEAILGAWAIDEHGAIHGDFLPNPRYDPLRWPAHVAQAPDVDGAAPR